MNKTVKLILMLVTLNTAGTIAADETMSMLINSYYTLIYSTNHSCLQLLAVQYIHVHALVYSQYM